MEFREVAFIAGFGNGGANLVFGAEWQNHNPLLFLKNHYVNMAGGWPLGPSSFGNPGTFQTTPAANVVADPACGVVLPAQGVAGGAASIPANLMVIVNVDITMFLLEIILILKKDISSLLL